MAFKEEVMKDVLAFKGRLRARAMCGFLTGLLALWASPAHAQTAVTGQVAELHATSAGNLPFRVLLVGAPILCAGGMAEGYLEDTESNYKVQVATLMMAKATGASVTLYSVVGAFGRCRITYMVMR